LTYDKLATASLAIRSGARFIATNPDRTLPTEQGLMPGAKAIFTAIQVATDVAPTVIGKPEPVMFQLAMSALGAPVQATAIVGDSLETDIRGGRALGLKTILLLSGVTSRQQLEQSELQPDLVYQDISALHADWRASESKQPLPQGD
jgi:4-nitrophenyl phosphatase